MPRVAKQSTSRAIFGRPPSWLQRDGAGLIADNVQGLSSRKKRQTQISRTPSDADSSDSDVGGMQLEPRSDPPAIEISADDSDVPDLPRTPYGKKRTTRITRIQSVEPEGSEPSRLQNATGEGEEIDMPVSWKRKAGKKRARISKVSSSDESDQPRKPKFVKGNRPPTPEEDLMDEVDESKIVESRLRTRKKQSAFEKNLEKLRRKKRKEAISESSSDEVAEEDEDSRSEPFEGARPDNGEDAGPDEVDEEEFVVEDDNADQAVQLPALFNMNTHQDISHHFKIICQLFVHLAVQDADERTYFMEKVMKDDEYFSVPLQMTQRKLMGLRDSLVTSSVWRTDFKNALQKHPEFTLTAMTFAIPSCDACHLGGRVSTLRGTASGTPYDRLTFEPDDDSSDDEDIEETEERRSQNENGISFHLGRFCARRTRVFHKFCHWEYELYTSLAEEVETLRNAGRKRGFVQVAFAGGIQPPDDITDADAIMEWLDQRQIISRELRKLKDMMEDARNLEIAAKRGDDGDE